MTSTLPVLNRRFVSQDDYSARAGETYSLLPFRSLPLDSNRQIITNFAGQYVVVSRAVVQDLVRKRIPLHSPIYDELKSRHFIIDDESSVALDLLAAQYRTTHATLANFTGLHLFVVTLRCDHSCPYCQVSRQSEDKSAFDMTPAMADRAIDFMFRSPSRALKVEFQGGEPLLNFELIRHVVHEVERRNVAEQRDIEFVITTNLAMLDDEHLRFSADHDIFFSTSLDGPPELHNTNRPRPGRDAYERTVAGIDRVRRWLGPDRISALMTTTAASLSRRSRMRQSARMRMSARVRSCPLMSLT